MGSDRCQAKRPDGKPCPNNAVEGSNYCAFHQPERMHQQAEEFARQFKRELLRQGMLSIFRRRLTDVGFGLGLLFVTALAVIVALAVLPGVDTAASSVLIYGFVLKLPIVLVGIFLFRQKQTIGLVVPLFYVPMDLLGALYYQTTGYTTPALASYYQLYWETPAALSIAAISICMAIVGYLLGKRL